MSNKVSQLGDKHTNSFFQQAWWLEAVAQNSWDEVRVEVDGELRARLPFVVQKRRGLTVLTMPPLTQTLGPWWLESEGKSATRLAREKELMSALIEQLPEHDYFSQSFHYSVTNALPFYWAGFDIHVRYTYIFEQLDLDTIWAEFQKNIRSHIRKAEKQVEVRDDLGIDAFIEVNTLTFERQGLTLPYSHDLVYRIEEACVQQEARRIFFAQDAQGRVHAAVYLVWDEAAAYILMSGGDPELRSSGATSLLIWRAIQFAAEVTRSFDFEGSMLEPVERRNRAFGAQQTPYLQVKRMNKRAELLYTGRNLLKTVLGR